MHVSRILQVCSRYVACDACCGILNSEKQKPGNPINIKRSFLLRRLLSKHGTDIFCKTLNMIFFLRRSHFSKLQGNGEMAKEQNARAHQLQKLTIENTSRSWLNKVKYLVGDAQSCNDPRKTLFCVWSFGPDGEDTDALRIRHL